MSCNVHNAGFRANGNVFCLRNYCTVTAHYCTLFYTAIQFSTVQYVLENTSQPHTVWGILRKPFIQAQKHQVEDLKQVETVFTDNAKKTCEFLPFM